ncbi:hypothetical protein BC937DRAFT_89461 [Endogone sp. FLAS-F59071]|nr:hypothetical protein BC937DRAFT_89461 [Endogone sp. FLAS-F59071]|eukprot:RUS22386.1 hypothetical protein BC937DRAFT_89461 [Endogone sp. FLAS-F59071]
MSLFSKFTKHSDKSVVYPWSQRKLNITSPLPRSGHSADQVALGNDIFLFGGVAKGQPRRDLFIIESTSLNSHPIVSNGEIPSPRSGHSTVTIGNYLLVFGGIPNTDEKCDESLYVLNVSTKQWIRPQIDGNLPLGRFGHSAVVVGSRMFIFGGQVDDHYLNDLIVFDVNTRKNSYLIFILYRHLNTVTSTAPQWDFVVAGNEAPAGRRGHISAYHDGKVYIFGGRDGEAFYNDLWAYDIQYNAWSQIQATNYIPSPRESAAATIVDDVIYVFGGRGPEDQEYGDLYAFRIRTKRWHTFSNMGPSPTPRYGHTLSTVKDKIFVLGGETVQQSPKGADESVIVYVLDTSKIKYPPDATGPPSPNNIPPAASEQQQQQQRQYQQQQQQLQQPQLQPQPQQLQQMHARQSTTPSQGPESPTSSSNFPSSSPTPHQQGPHPTSNNSASRNNHLSLFPNTSPENASRGASLRSSSIPQAAPMSPQQTFAFPMPPSQMADQNNNSGSLANLDKGRPARHASMVPEAALRRPRPTSPMPLGNIDSRDAFRDPNIPPTPLSPLAADGNSADPHNHHPNHGFNGQRSPSPAPGARPLPGGPPPLSPGLIRTGAVANENAPPPRPSREGVDIGPIYRNTVAMPNGLSGLQDSHNIGEDPRRPKSHIPTPEERQDVRATSPTSRVIPQRRPATEVPTLTPASTPSNPIMLDNVNQDPTSAKVPPQQDVDTNSTETSGGQATRPTSPAAARNQRANPTQRRQSPTQRSTSPTKQRQTGPPRRSASPTNGRPKQPPGERTNSIESVNSTTTVAQPQEERTSLIREIKARDMIISDMKKKEQWWRTEVSLARKIRGKNERAEISEEEDILLMDVGEIGSEKYKVFDDLVKVKIELRKVKSNIAQQAQHASQKITQAERMRTAALQEAAYFKSKYTAIKSGQTGDLAKIETARAQELEKRLAATLLETDALQNRLGQIQKQAHHDHLARQSAEDRAKEAHLRAEEAQQAHARALDELESLHARATAAESQLREHTSRLSEVTAKLNNNQTDQGDLQDEVETLRQQISQYERAMEKANTALRSATTRSEDAERLWAQARSEISSLEQQAASWKSELEVKSKDYLRVQEQANEMERLWKNAREEADSVKAMMQEGVVELLNVKKGKVSKSRDAQGEDDDEKHKLKLHEFEQQVESLRVMNKDTQALADRASSSLSDAMIKISQLEASGMKARSEVATLKQRLSEAVDEVAKTKTTLSDKELLLAEKTRELEDEEVRVGMMREAMIKKGFKIDENALAPPKSDSGTRIRELEIQLSDMENKLTTSYQEAEKALEESRYNHQAVAQAEKEAIDRAMAAEAKIISLEAELEKLGAGSSVSAEEAMLLTKTVREELERQLKDAEQNNVLLEKHLGEVNKSTQEKIQQLESDYQTAAHLAKGTESMLKKAKADLAESQAKVQSMEEELDTLHLKNSELVVKLAELDGDAGSNAKAAAQLEEERRKWVEEKALLESQIAELQEKLAHLENKALDSSSRVNELLEELTNSRSEKDALEQEIKSTRSRHVEAKKETSGQQRKLNQDIQRLQKSLDETNSELEEALQLNERLNKDLDALQSQKEGIKDQALLEAELHRLKNENKALENKISLLLEQLDHSEDNASEQDDNEDTEYSDVDDEDEDEDHSQDGRNSVIIDSLTNELDALKSQWDGNQPDESRDEASTEYSDIEDEDEEDDQHWSGQYGQQHTQQRESWDEGGVEDN